MEWKIQGGCHNQQQIKKAGNHKKAFKNQQTLAPKPTQQGR